ncbi:hypothetical protein [Lebetimonas natsushimae]|uniref:hypothetical protein n=1 Tax=Lebetimonas natsushimae TaxID=1936991 RepID=UPI001EE6A815|nr:hypothetical protein [Lebetimonas natsushimae]
MIAGTGEDKQKRIEIAKDNRFYNCINSQKCVMICPKGMASAYDIKALQNMHLNTPFNNEMNFFKGE